MAKSNMAMRGGRWLAVGAAILCLCGCIDGAEKRFSLTPAPAKGENIAIRMSVYSLGKYLADCQVNRPEILNEVRTLLGKGGYYYKKTKDQKSRPTTLTVYVDTDYMLHIVTLRDDPCPNCKGSGLRAAPFDKITNKIDINFNCLACKGTGIQPGHTTEKYYILSGEDFEKPEEGRQLLARKAFAEAPQGAEAWVDRLASNNPNERLEACMWLDKNYIKVGMFFQDAMPMLKKARYYDANEKKKIMVWQFWAGKDIPNERNRAYYRIYADSKSGKITKKGFFAAN